MAQFLILNGLNEISVVCPACDTPLTLQSKQDDRVAILHHAGAQSCALYNQRYRVNRLNGYGEIIHEA